MNPIDAEWASNRLGELLEQRVQVVQAIHSGEYDRALRVAESLIRASDEALERIGRVPEALPHRRLAVALRLDFDLARLMAGLPVFDWIPPPPEDFGPDIFNATRYCPHDRPSIDGNCMARPPCPRRSR